MGMKSTAAVALLVVLVIYAATAEAKKKDSEKICDAGWECTGSKYCCNQTISKIFQVYQFENLFSKRNAPVAHAVGFWDYQTFITASTFFQPLGFGTTGGKQMQMMEIAAFLGHVGAKTSCKFYFLIWSVLFLAQKMLTILSG
jgi:Chitinase class I